MVSQSKSQKKNFTRREWLGLAWISSLGILGGALGRAFWKFLLPRQKENTLGGIFSVGAVEDLPEASSPPLNVPEGRFFIVNSDQGVAALHKVCTHLDCLLSWDEQANTFVCPCHGSQFDRQGTCLQGPATRNLDQFVIQLIDAEGKVVSETDPVTGGPLPLPMEAAIMENTPEADEEPASEEPVPAEETRSSGLQVRVDTGRIIRL